MIACIWLWDLNGLWSSSYQSTTRIPIHNSCRYENVIQVKRVKIKYSRNSNKSMRLRRIVVVVVIYRTCAIITYYMHSTFVPRLLCVRAFWKIFIFYNNVCRSHSLCETCLYMRTSNIAHRINFKTFESRNGKWEICTVHCTPQIGCTDFIHRFDKKCKRIEWVIFSSG